MYSFANHALCQIFLKLCMAIDVYVGSQNPTQILWGSGPGCRAECCDVINPYCYEIILGKFEFFVPIDNKHDWKQLLQVFMVFFSYWAWWPKILRGKIFHTNTHPKFPMNTNKQFEIAIVSFFKHLLFSDVAYQMYLAPGKGALFWFTYLFINKALGINEFM